VSGTSSSSAAASGAAPLAGRHALVTGGARGIGAAVALELARLGASVTITGRSIEALEARRDELQAATGLAVRAVRMDVTDPASVADACAHARRLLGPPAILVNNAGAAESAPFARTDLAMWRRMHDANATGAFLCTRVLLPDMLAAGWGRVVSVASIAGLRGIPYTTAYVAAKHALVGLTRALALEVARSGVTVNAVCPGYTDTALVAGAVATIVAKTGRTAEEARAELVRGNPQGRLIRPEEVAAAVGWLCLPSSAATNGIALAIDGGELA